jgi:hypothetical protein
MIPVWGVVVVRVAVVATPSAAGVGGVHISPEVDRAVPPGSGGHCGGGSTHPIHLATSGEGLILPVAIRRSFRFRYLSTGELFADMSAYSYIFLLERGAG